jgi:hypothetical protein
MLFVSDSDYDDIFGDSAPAAAPQPRLGRPRTRDKYPEVRQQQADEQQRMYEFYQSREGQRAIKMASTGRGHEVAEKEFYMPVGVSFLSKVLRLHQDTVARRLQTVTPVGHAGTSQNRPLYDFATVVPFLVKPKMDIRTYLRSLNPADMPTNISKVFWEAERIRNKTLLETGEAWPTEKVLQVMGQVFMMIKDRIPLINEGMREEGLTDAQLEKLQLACDQFQRDLHEALVELPGQQATPSRLAEVAVGVEED